MISWDIKDSKEKRKNWFFPSFEIQEYMLPLMHVGGADIDEYGDTEYTIEDCVRLRKAIAYILKGLSFTNKKKIRYETLSRGLETFDKSLIIEAFQNLDVAANEAIEKQKGLVFYGD
ncbi:MAG: hypothetical protein P8179_17725 [Candidatus Thiodiazotropha sp.]|jgi:hypothetical protein